MLPPSRVFLKKNSRVFKGCILCAGKDNSCFLCPLIEDFNRVVCLIEDSNTSLLKKYQEDKAHKKLRVKVTMQAGKKSA